MAVVAMLAAFVSSSDASSGGVGVGDETTESCAGGDFGERTMRLGDCGGDVKTLNWLLSSKRVAREAPLGKTFESATEAGVAGFQENRGLETTGVVDQRTSSRLGRSMQRDLATW